MSGKVSKPKSRKEYDQMKRNKMSDQKSVSNNESMIERCKKLLRKKDS
jgi:hypothetical protein